ncbi:MAG: DUF5696 domain-containing protein [Acutalibacteraceae bacterium]
MLKRRSFFLLALSVMLCVSLCACMPPFGASRRIREGREKTGIIQATVDKDVYFCGKTLSEMELIASCGMMRLYLDRDTFGLALQDRITAATWRSLPESAVSGAAAAELTVLIDGREYILNSQRDSVALGAVQAETGENTLTVTYSFPGAGIVLPLVYTLGDSLFTVEIDCENIICGKDTVIKSLSLLPFFGACKSEEGAYALLPDGSGALLSFGETARDYGDKSVRIYGRDLACYGEETAAGGLAAFGVMRGKAAFLALADEGEEMMTLTAHKTESPGDYHRVWPSFSLTPTYEDAGGAVFAGKNPYMGKIRLSYRFLGGESAGYIGMASACREMLIGKGVLGAENTVESEKAYPFNIRLVTSAILPDEKGRLRRRTVSSYSQSLELLKYLRAKDFSEINLIMEGLLENESMGLSTLPGKKSEFKILADYAAQRGCRIFAKSSFLFTESKISAAKAIDGKPLAFAEGYLTAGSNPEKNMKKLLSVCADQAIDGLFFANEGKVLYSDFSASGMSAAETAEKISRQCAAASALKKTAIGGANIYSVKYADMLLDLPDGCSGEDDYYTAVPFLQAVLHGTVQYSLSPANESDSSVDAMLKAIEYGAVPYYRWQCADTGEGVNYYMNSVSEAQAFYGKMRAMFADLTAAKITGHEKIREGVYLTVYSNSTKIYVNYTSGSVTVSGITVDPKSAIRVN